MKLTKANKAHIDSLSYTQLLRHNRFAPVGDDWFEGDTGDYWFRVMAKKREADPGAAVAASKSIGWDG